MCPLCAASPLLTVNGKKPVPTWNSARHSMPAPNLESAAFQFEGIACGLPSCFRQD